MIDISSLEVRKRLGDLLNRVALRHDQFTISRKGQVLAALVPVEKLAQLEKAAQVHLLDVLNRSSVAQERDDDKLMALVDEAKHDTRPPQSSY